MPASASAALAFGGDGAPPGSTLANTEEWNSPSNVINTLTD